jgi:hypothetical protein
VSLDRKRWALLAHDLKFSQLDVARKQAEAWRIGLASLTALLTSIFALKDRDNVSVITHPYQVIVVALLSVSLILLLAATMLVSRALAGPPGEEILLTGEGLEQWTQYEVRKISKTLRSAPWLAVAGILAVAAAVGINWLAPSQGSTLVVQVTDSTGQSCGQLVGITKQEVMLRTATATADVVLIPVSSIVSLVPVANCS